MPGVKVGDGCIIGTNAVVAKDIPPYSIAVGNPARVIKRRFEENTIERLLKLKWWDMSIETIEENYELLQDRNIELFISKFER